MEVSSFERAHMTRGLLHPHAHSITDMSSPGQTRCRPSEDLLQLLLGEHRRRALGLGVPRRPGLCHRCPTSTLPCAASPAAPTPTASANAAKRAPKTGPTQRRKSTEKKKSLVRLGCEARMYTLKADHTLEASRCLLVSCRGQACLGARLRQVRRL